MQAVDTNVVLRLFVADDAAQAERARKLFDDEADVGGALWLADVVLVELVWALDRVYGRSRADIAKALRALAGNATVQLESPDTVSEATSLFAAGKVDFADALLAAKAAQAGCDALRTFDRGMRGLPNVRLL